MLAAAAAIVAGAIIITATAPANASVFFDVREKPKPAVKTNRNVDLTVLEDLRALKIRTLARSHIVPGADTPGATTAATAAPPTFEPHMSTDEVKARLEVIDRLILYADSHWSRKSGRGKAGAQAASQGDQQSGSDFLKAGAAAMAEQAEKSGNDQRFAPFFRNLGLVAQELRDTDLKAAAILDGYLNFSSVLDAKDPNLFIRSRDYTNGKTFEAAQPLSREDLIELQ
jgi:hypothetical protein